MCQDIAASRQMMDSAQQSLGSSAAAKKNRRCSTDIVVSEPMGSSHAGHVRDRDLQRTCNRQGIPTLGHSMFAHVCGYLCVQEQGEADKARLKQQQEEEREANRRQHDKIQAEKALVEAALERLEIENRERADSVRQAEAAAAKTRAAELAAEEAKKRDIILQLRLVCWKTAIASCYTIGIAS